MKDSTDKGTEDMFGEKRGRGRPKTGHAKTAAERQAAYRSRQQAEYLTVRLPKGLAQTLKDAQMKAVRNGTPAVELTPLQAGELLKAIRASERTALRGQRPRPQAKPTA
jgi:hypothetical protein